MKKIIGIVFLLKLKQKMDLFDQEIIKDPEHLLLDS
jgi:hypothetical protein